MVCGVVERDQVESFRLPPDVTVKFVTREGTVVRDEVAGRIELNPGTLDERLVVQSFSRETLCTDYYLIDPTSDPPLQINQVPPGYEQFIPRPTQSIRLSEILNLPQIQTLPRPLTVVWCACRAITPQPAWKDTLRR